MQTMQTMQTMQDMQTMQNMQYMQPELGRASMKMLDRINSEVMSKTKLRQ